MEIEFLDFKSEAYRGGYYEYVGGKSNKFWATIPVSVDGAAKHFTVWGKIGRPPQGSKAIHPSASATKINGKVKKGYSKAEFRPAYRSMVEDYLTFQITGEKVQPGRERSSGFNFMEELRNM